MLCPRHMEKKKIPGRKSVKEQTFKNYKNKTY